MPVHERQVAIGRLLAVGLTGNLIGAAISGVIGDLFGWRGVFFSIGGFGLVVAVDRVLRLSRHRRSPSRSRSTSPPPWPDFAACLPIRAPRFCFGSVFFEGIVIHGMFPYVALLLLAAGQTHSSYAGIVIAGFGLGGIIFSLALPFLVAASDRAAADAVGRRCARRSPSC